MIDVTVAKDSPDDPVAVLILAHGAGGDLNDPLLRAVAAGLVQDRLEVVRFNFPYRELGRRAPGAQSQSEECYRAVADSVRRDRLPLYIGGKSYGGRMASHIAADGYASDGLIFLSYPLHPPGKLERIRDEHLSAINAPMLFIQGTKDPFATPHLLTNVVETLPNAKLHSIEGGDHSLRVRGRAQSDVVEEVCATICQCLLLY